MQTAPASRRAPAGFERSRTIGGLEGWLPAVAASALALAGVTRRSIAARVVGIAGGALAYGTLSGRLSVPDWLRARLPVTGQGAGATERVVTILRPPDDTCVASGARP